MRCRERRLNLSVAEARDPPEQQGPTDIADRKRASLAIEHTVIEARPWNRLPVTLVHDGLRPETVTRSPPGHPPRTSSSRPRRASNWTPPGGTVGGTGSADAGPHRPISPGFVRLPFLAPVDP